MKRYCVVKKLWADLLGSLIKGAAVVMFLGIIFGLPLIMAFLFPIARMSIADCCQIYLFIEVSALLLIIFLAWIHNWISDAIEYCERLE